MKFHFDYVKISMKSMNKNIAKNKSAVAGVIVLLIIALVGGYFWLKSNASKVYVEQAQISASQINLTSSGGGTLQETFASEGDILAPNSLIARVNNEIIKTRTGGQLIKLNGGIGRVVAKGETIATLIDPDDLHVVGQIAENKGLKDIQVGQAAYFTVDAYGSQKFYGTVSEVSPTSDEGSLTFKISDKRETKNFDVKISFDHTQYPELKNGMSSKVWIEK